MFQVTEIKIKIYMAIFRKTVPLHFTATGSKPNGSAHSINT